MVGAIGLFFLRRRESDGTGCRPVYGRLAQARPPPVGPHAPSPGGGIRSLRSCPGLLRPSGRPDRHVRGLGLLLQPRSGGFDHGVRARYRCSPGRHRCAPSDHDRGTRASSRDDAMPSVRDCGPIFVRVLRELPAATPPSDLRGKDRAVAEDPNYGKAASAMTYRGGAIVYEPFREGYGGGRASTPGIARLITRKGQAQTDPVQSAANGSFGTQITYSPW